MKTRIYNADEQKLFRRVLEKKGAEKGQAIKELIEQRLDDQHAIIEWLKRNGNFTLYAGIKSTYAGEHNGQRSDAV